MVVILFFSSSTTSKSAQLQVKKGVPEVPDGSRSDRIGSDLTPLWPPTLLLWRKGAPKNAFMEEMQGLREKVHSSVQQLCFRCLPQT